MRLAELEEREALELPAGWLWAPRHRPVDLAGAAGLAVAATGQLWELRALCLRNLDTTVELQDKLGLSQRERLRVPDSAVSTVRV